MDELEAVGEPELRATFLWATSQERPVTADDLAAAHGLHRNVARSRLERLADAGLLRSTYERRTGRSGPGAGRPAKLYAVSPQLAAIEFPVRRYESLLGLVLDALQAEEKPERLRAIGAEFGRQLVRSAPLRPVRSVHKGLQRLGEALGGLGYQVSVVEVTAERGLLTTPTCPLRPLIRARPEAADLDRGMWSGLAAAAIAGVEGEEVVCKTHGCLDGGAPCRILLELRTPSF
jgi:predicted ArsR family transcriptional regulator